MKETYYKNLAQLLVSRIGDRHYYNGTARIEDEEITGELKSTLIIYRELLLDPTDMSHAVNRITDIVPVWWEFSAYNTEGSIPNDFSWSEFRPYLLAAF